MFKTIQEKLGPGLLYAAAAVGVSHLVQSTRAGATYGLIMVAFVVFICLLKYPTFLFGARYTAATGETLVDGYARMGKWIVILYFFMQLFEYTLAIAGVAVVTAGLVKSVFDLGIGDIPMAIGLVLACLAVLSLGRYALLEDITKVLVIIFTIGTIIAAVVAIGAIDTGGVSLSAEMTLDTPTILFLVAVAGWMPTGTAGAVGLSLWVKAKQIRLGRPITIKEADFDFNVGYFTAIFTAVCFVALGTYVMFIDQLPLEGDSAGFATQLIGLFTSTIGAWIYPVIALAAITVMFSTLLTLVDLLPRTSAAVVTRLAPGQFESRQAALYIGFIVVELVLVSAVLVALMDSFATFIDFVTSMGFIVAPVISLLNHLAMFSPLVPVDKQPGPVLKNWSYVTIVTLTLVALIFVYLKATT